MEFVVIDKQHFSAYILEIQLVLENVSMRDLNLATSHISVTFLGLFDTYFLQMFRQ